MIERVCPPDPDSRVLDVGCGSGVISNYLAPRCAFVDAIDGNPAAIEYARDHAVADNMAFHLGLVDEVHLEADTYDRIYCLEVIEHIYQYQGRTLLEQLGRLLRRDGLLFLTTPNYVSLWPLIEWLMDVLRLAPRMKDDQHVCKFSRSRLRRMARDAGLEEVRIGRFSGMAPFASVISWRMAELFDEIETRLANPLGNVLFGVWRKAAS
ncbi:MAG: methyltransferase domain-containing protein [Phycisphaerae bacterium]|nr:methyltransferase domain-containing protein [Phycisphaerae bacterium]